MLHHHHRRPLLVLMGARPMILVVQEVAAQMVSATSRTSQMEPHAPTMATLVRSISASQEAALIRAER